MNGFYLTCIIVFHTFTIGDLFVSFIGSNKMKRILITLLGFYSLSANAQNYLISFAGTGASTTVNSVKVENLTAGTSITLGPGDVLNLTLATAIKSVESKESSELKIYPNPMTDNARVQIPPPAKGKATITVFDMIGKPVSEIQAYLDNYSSEFQISNLKSGSYLVIVKGNSWQFSGKLLSKGMSNLPASIKKISNTFQGTNEETKETNKKGFQGAIDMIYNTGDRIKFTGISGNYSTVISDIPSSDKTIIFNFTACTDGDNNNYSIVEIGDQTWMAENLRTTKYLNGNLIGTTTPATLDINAETTPKYQWALNGNEINVLTYGRLYTWYAVTDSRNVCPAGWHVPTKDDWITMAYYLVYNGYAYDGTLSGDKIAKSLASTILWDVSVIKGAIGNTDYPASRNKTGFTALPGSARSGDGTFGNIGFGGLWWTSTIDSNGNVSYMFLNFHLGGINFSTTYDPDGFSVRCVKDN
jgi:uncharacterized protein (TIGR02145 family)